MSTAAPAKVIEMGEEWTEETLERARGFLVSLSQLMSVSRFHKLDNEAVQMPIVVEKPGGRLRENDRGHRGRIHRGDQRCGALVGEVKLVAPPLTLEEARTLEIPLEARKLLAPQDVARLCAVPLGVENLVGSLTVAVDPTAPENLERLLRAQLGVRSVEVRQASREALETIIASQLVPLWKERGLQFSGLPALPASSHPRVAPAAAPGPGIELNTSQVRAEPCEAAHPVVLFIESDVELRKSITQLVLESGHEPRFASTLDDVAREAQVSPPALVVARRGCAVSPDDLGALLRRLPGSVELRTLKSYAGALVGGEGDDRLPVFLFDIVRFFLGVTVASRGGSLASSDSRARAAERASRWLQLKPHEIEAARLASLFADLEEHLGRGGKESFGAEGGNSSVPHEGLAQLLDPARTPYPIRSALDGRRERFDGSGPRKLAGEAIPAPARVLAAVEAFHAAQARGFSGAALESALRAEAGKSLDPRAVEAVLRVERAERLVGSLDSVGDRVLVVDPDPIAASLLQMRLSNAGFSVEVVQDGESALSAVSRGGVHLVISEIAVPRIDGLTLLLRMKRLEATRDLPFLFVSERSDRGSTVKALELGADDYVTKPPDLELLTAKVKSILRKARDRRPAAPAGDSVAGSLSELDLADLLQALGSSRRSVRVQVDGNQGGTGELVLEKGRVVDARTGSLRGAEAFFEVFCWPKGRFTLRANDSAQERTIDVALEVLLLEGCRQRDEVARRG